MCNSAAYFLRNTTIGSCETSYCERLILGRYLLLFGAIEGKNIETGKYIFELYYTINNEWAFMLVTFKRLSFS